MMPVAKELSELHGRKLDRPLKTVYDILSHPPNSHGSKVAIVSMHQPAKLYSKVFKGIPTAEYLRWTFDEIARVSHVMALALAEGGVLPGMTIAAFVENNIESQILFRACLELNCPLALLNPKSAINHRELLHMFEILQPSVVVAPNQGIAEVIDEVVVEDMKGVLLKLTCSGETVKHWQSFGAFLEGGLTSNETILDLSIERKPEDVVLIFFTSGTTSLPKGVPHTNDSWGSVLLGNPMGFGISETSISCSHLPFFHSLGLAFLAYFNAYGCTAVIPAAAFNPRATLAAISLEGTNIFPSVPAMNSALLNHPDWKETSVIDHIIIGTTSVSSEYMTKTVADFGAQRISDGYGLTETGAIWFHRSGTKPSDSYPCPEIMVRVCDSETDEVVPRGMQGELHCGGTSVVTRYLLSKEQGEGPNKSFYEDNSGHWLRTGDQVVMDDSGEIRMIGRYKDLIKRGGENLSPGLIELVLAEDFGLVAEVVGVPDEIVGEVPFAIVKEIQNYDMSNIRGKLVKKLGPLFALEDVLTLKAIGLDDFPKTHSGKTKKHVLKEKATEYLKAKAFSREGNRHDVESEVQIETLTTLWSKHLGVSNLHPQQNILEFADSLTLARFSAVLRRATGHFLSLQQLLDNPTIEAQTRALSSQNTRQEDMEFSKMVLSHNGPPTSNDMIHAMGDEDIYDKTQALSKQILLPLGLSWNDVEDIIPMHPALKRLLERRRPQSNNHRRTWLCRGKTVKELEEALQKALAHHSILRAMSIHYDSKTPLHVILRPSQTLYSQMLTHMSPVKNAEELWRQSYNKSEDWAADPGPLFRATLCYVEQENCAGLVYMGQHSTFDAISFELFSEDLDASLINPQASLIPRVPYKAWADIFYDLQHSATAQNSIKWQAKRLKGVSNHKKSLFPEQRAPEWFKGQSDGWISLPDGNTGPTRKALDGGITDGAIGIVQQVKLQDAKSLKLQHAIEVPQIAKVALAIVNTRRTKSNVALFGQYQAARSWPFIPNWQASLLPDVMNLGGPTLQTTAVIANVNKTDVLGTLLLKLQEEQSGLNKHSHAPYDQLIDRLNDGGSKDGDVVVEIIRRQIFNWLPGGLAPEYKSLQMVHHVSRADVGILWNISMVDEAKLQVHMSWDDAQLSGQEATEMLNEYAVVISQVSKIENWGKTVERII